MGGKRSAYSATMLSLVIICKMNVGLLKTGELS